MNIQNTIEARVQIIQHIDNLKSNKINMLEKGIQTIRYLIYSCCLTTPRLHEGFSAPCTVKALSSPGGLI